MRRMKTRKPIMKNAPSTMEMMATGPVPDKTMPPAFVEMMVPQAVGVSECTIELEGRNGKLRIHWKGAAAADLAGLSRALWEAAS